MRPNETTTLDLPPASSLPAGATVLSLSGTDRSELRKGVIIWAGVVGTIGLGIGYWLGKRYGGRP